jgi:hypothetical protein
MPAWKAKPLGPFKKEEMVRTCVGQVKIYHSSLRQRENKGLRYIFFLNGPNLMALLSTLALEFGNVVEISSSLFCNNVRTVQD